MDPLYSRLVVPGGGSLSATYARRFNTVARGLGIRDDLLSHGRACFGNGDTLVTAADVLRRMIGNGEGAVRLIGPLTRVADEIERRRLEKVEQAYHFPRWIPYQAPVDRLSEVERAAVAIFATEVKPVLDRIEARQHRPDADLLATWMDRHGDYFSRLLFERFRRDTAPGPYGTDSALSLFPFFPDAPLLNGMMEACMTPKEFEDFGARLREGAEELRPTTVLFRDQDGTIRSIPLPLHSRFREDHERLAESLQKIANLGVNGACLDPRLRDQLKKWALFFHTGNALDEAAAVQATIDAGEGGGNLRVHIGPSESYWPDNTKFPYLLQVGIRDWRLISHLRRREGTFLAMERSLKGIPHYQPRLLSTRGGFADPIYQAVTGGFIETLSGGEPGGNNFPNYGYGVHGASRFVILEWVENQAERIKEVLTGLLDEEISDWDARRYITEAVVDHESGHMLGPPRDHVTPSGKRMGAVFGRHWGSADEPKADLAVIQTVRLLRKKGEITGSEWRDAVRGIIGMNLSWRYKGKVAFERGLTDHFYGHMIEVGYYFNEGIFKLVEGGAGRPGTRIQIDYERLPNRSAGLWRKIIAFQAAGDVDGFLSFGRELVEAIPDEADQLILSANQDQRPFLIQRHL